MIQVVLEPIIPPEASEKDLESEIVAWFVKNVFAPLFAVFEVARQNVGMEWEEFPEEMEPLGLDRAALPQIPSEDRAALRRFLAAKGIDSVSGWAFPDKLKPTQKLFSRSKLESARAHKGENRAILASRDGYILDGHHQWLKSRLDDPEGKIEVVMFDSTIRRLARESKMFYGVSRDNAGPVDVAPLIAALNSGKVQYSNGVFSGQFSASISKALRSFGGRLDKAGKTFQVPINKIPYEVRGALAASAARADEIKRQFSNTLGQIAATTAEAAALGINLEGYTLALVSDLQKQFRKSLVEATEATPAVEAVSVVPDFTESMIRDVRRNLTENVELSVKTFTEEEVLTLRKLAEENWMAGGRIDLLQEIVRERFGVTQRKAEFLAKQETSMVASEFARAQAQEIGSTSYVWYCRHDDRVRPDHQILNGTTQSWDEPPVVDRKTGRRKNPGCDWGCRCVARAVLNLAAGRQVA